CGVAVTSAWRVTHFRRSPRQRGHNGACAPGRRATIDSLSVGVGDVVHRRGDSTVVFGARDHALVGPKRDATREPRTPAGLPEPSGPDTQTTMRATAPWRRTDQ